MGSYIDTSTIISYALKGDKNHPKALQLIDEIKDVEEFYISTLTILELHSVLSRRINDYKIPPSFEKIASPSSKVKIAVKYTIESIKLNIIPDNSMTEKLGSTGFDGRQIFHESIELAPKIKLRTLDLMHATYAYLNKDCLDCIISFDKDFKKKKDLIEEHTDLSVKF